MSVMSFNKNPQKRDKDFKVFFTCEDKNYESLTSQIIAISRPTVTGANLINETENSKTYELRMEETIGELQFEFTEDVLNRSVFSVYELLEGDGFVMSVEVFDPNEFLLDKLTLKECQIVEISSSELDYSSGSNRDHQAKIQIQDGVAQNAVVSWRTDPGYTGFLSKVVTVTFKSAEHTIHNPPTIN